MSGIATRRSLFVGLVLLTSAWMSLRLWEILRVDGTTTLEALLLALFALLSTRIASSFWRVFFGAWVMHNGAHAAPRLERPDLRQPRPVPGADARVAVVMPVYNEDIRRCLAALEAMREALLRGADAGRFDFFVLSDSTDAHCQQAERSAWRALRERLTGVIPIYYRHRSQNLGRKSGNIAEFCQGWGGAYEYLIVLDADSLMTAEAITELTVLMDMNPHAALIQTPPRLVGRQTLFARLQQFASNVYGPIVTAGVAALDGPDGNYWGHNAILRMQPFVRHCGLPQLPGRPPLGGDILSHDFVEAALLRRAGWEVWMAPDIDGSYEEVPPTLVDYLKRDRRWCQGNLQHLRLLFARGLRSSGRLHFASGAMAYLASPLWLALLVVALANAEVTRHVGVGEITYNGRYPVLSFVVPHTLEFVALLSLTFAMLFAQKVAGVVAALADRERREAHGGAVKLIASALLETAYASLLAPVFMISHTWFVLQVIGGLSTGWGRQQRTEGATAGRVVLRMFLPHTLIGFIAAIAVRICDPGGMWWWMPLVAGLMLAIPLANAGSSVRLGSLTRRAGLFLIPSETRGLPILERTRELAAPLR